MLQTGATRASEQRYRDGSGCDAACPTHSRGSNEWIDERNRLVLSATRSPTHPKRADEWGTRHKAPATEITDEIVAVASRVARFADDVLDWRTESKRQ